MQWIAELEVDREHGRVYEHGWQSCDPSSDRPVTGSGFSGFQGEGLLAVSPSPGTTHLFATTSPYVVPSIRATLTGTKLVIEADGPVEHLTVDRSPYDALGAWAESFAAAPAEIRAAPTGWSSRYEYRAAVTDADIRENVEAIAKHDLPVDVIQLDDGWQSTIGDWLRPAPRFDPYSTFSFHGHRPRRSSLEGLTGLTDFIRSSGHRPGIWVAPFIAGSDSDLLRRHPDWAGPSIGTGWNQTIHALDLTSDEARAHLIEVFAELAQYFDYFKLDYLFAGALANIPLYRHTLAEIRETLGTAYLVAGRAPLLPTIGLVDAMRVSADITPDSQEAATLNTKGRAWQHGRLWVNDPGPLMAHPEVEHRADWADTITRHGGLRTTSDRIQSLDGWGLAITKALLSSTPPPTPFPSV
ncbi:glycoside hydrolase family 36 protein [Streptomyces sp. SID13031]|uniref:glycoside hydrolase family 36 protein n=1 Tax=Streptomyces sp. SID13031 TaxID=2706046 RepID=UPI0013C6510B|nr:glycoside hydrolase family 36 protein [Streptomyces sp. SID13031]NEA33222.1 alpha-galactosidase [Streptomyces sp. SID13031]